ncbi:collagenase-like [Uranotaenia lowii]|uniref:collagenase-like n=1 Tax=Uranotaenia lowii TaxID=190385 RepID=UPI002479F710|nr:collagenase-like [Uranotaenia lowii]
MFPRVNFAIFVSLVSIGSIRADEEGRIVNGENAEYGQFPYQAMLLLQMSQGTALCGGSLINSRYVVTAGHCVDGIKSIQVRLGSIFFNGRNPDGSPDGSVVMNTTDFAAHPDYDPNTLQNDIALVHLPEAVEFTDRIAPVALPAGNDDYTGRVAIASGFGLTRTAGSPADRLKFAPLNVISNGACRFFYPGGTVQPTTLCCRGDNRRSTCNGDSGGPLTLEDNGQTALIGVVSFGNRFAGCDAGFPVGFTRVTEFVDYIEENTADG